MIHRRHFLRAGATGLAGLLAARQAFAEELDRLPAGLALQPTRLREEYMLDPAITYLNHGSIGTIPRVVHEARVGYLAACETNPHAYMWETPWRDALAETRGKAAALLGCTTEEVAFTHNTTEAFNLLALGLPLRPADEVLFSSLNHISASFPWIHHGRRAGYSIRSFDIPMDAIPALTPAEVVAMYEREIQPNTRVLVVPEVDNVVGLRHPVAEIAAMAHAKGVEFVAVDGAQILGMLPVTVEGADFYAASPHKWLQAPKGLGLLYVRKELQPVLAPMWVKHPRRELPQTAEVYEDYSTRNLPEVIALGDAIDFQTRLEPAAKQARYMELRRAFREGVERTKELRWRSAEDESLSCSLFAVETVGRDAREVWTSLNGQGIIVRAFGPPTNTLRVSPNLVTTEADMVRFLRAAAA